MLATELSFWNWQAQDIWITLILQVTPTPRSAHGLALGQAMGPKVEDRQALIW
jgi:hypothetical protein